MVHRCLEAAAVLAERDIEAEVVDLRTLLPLDQRTMIESVQRTNKMIVHEATCTGGVAPKSRRGSRQRPRVPRRPIVSRRGLRVPYSAGRRIHAAVGRCRAGRRRTGSVLRTWSMHRGRAMSMPPRGAFTGLDHTQSRTEKTRHGEDRCHHAPDGGEHRGRDDHEMAEEAG
jgi:hypothetical protein